MANAVLAFDNLVDRPTTTLSASTEEPNLGAANLADPSPQVLWRSTAGGSQFVQADLGSSLSVQVIAFCQTRSGLLMAPVDTVRLRLDVTTPGTGAVHDSGAVASGIDGRFGYWLTLLPAPVSARYVRLTFPAFAGYRQVGRLWVAPAIQPVRNFAYDWGREWGDGSTVTRAPKSGVLFVDTGPRFRRVSVAFPALSSAEADAVDDGDQLAGISGQVLLCTDPASPARRTILGRATQVAPITQRAFPVFSRAYTIEEDL